MAYVNELISSFPPNCKPENDLNVEAGGFFSIDPVCPQRAVQKLLVVAFDEEEGRVQLLYGSSSCAAYADSISGLDIRTSDFCSTTH